MSGGSLRRAHVRTTFIAVLLAALVAPAGASAADYVAMGDSYSSGTGTRAYYEGCERSVYAYPYLIKSSFGSSFSFVACGGAKTQDVLSNQVQKLDAGTDYVTISVGGNDAGFSSVITECAKPEAPWQHTCETATNNAQNFIRNTLPGRLNNVYSEIRERAPSAVVAVVGYPRLFNGEDCNAGTFFSGDDLSRLNATADVLAATTRTRALAHGMTFVDARAAFRGHAVCDDAEWLNGLANPTGESYHPNRTGHSSGYAGIVRAALQAAPRPDAPVGGVGRIAFSSSRSGDNDVWVVNADGQFPVNLTEHPASDVDPAWSPDGTKVAFASNRDGDNEIFVVNGDGTGLTQLTANGSDDRDPAWSPNGAYLAFRSNRTGNNEIFRMTATGAAQTNLTNNGASDFAPAWSPDGSEIAFQRFTSGNDKGEGNEVFKANADGQGQTNYTNTAASTNDGRPAWSPDGGTIAFHSNRDGDFEIYTAPALGGTVTARTSHSADDQDPTYSPTGAQIAFQSDRTGDDELFTMPSTGSNEVNRTSIDADDRAPDWQADSTPPSTRISVAPAGPVNDARPTFEFAASELGAKLECRIDNGAYATCTSPFRPETLPDGEHTFSVRSTDPAGNRDTAPVVRTFVVDTIAPEVDAQCPQSVLLNTPASAAVRASDATSGMASIDDPTGEHALDTTQPGMQTFLVHAIDLAGNRAEAECRYDVRYPDPGTPELSAGETPNAGDFAVAWSPSAPPEYPVRYVLQRRDAAGEQWRDVASELAEATHAFTAGDVRDEGTWRFRVKGVDAEHGLETGWSEVSSEVKVDQTAPAAPSLSTDRDPEYAGDGGWFRDEVTVTTSDNGDPALRDGSAPSGIDAASVPQPQTVTEPESFSESVRDLVGHESVRTTLDVQVDAERPSLELDCPAAVLLGGGAEVRVTAADAQSGLAEDPTGTVEVDTSKPGTQVIERTAVDNVGHRRTQRCEVLVHYAYSGLREPLDAGGPNALRRGSTVPLKFSLSDAEGRAASGAAVEIHLERTRATEDGTEIEEVVEATATNGKDVRDDDGDYRFNLSTQPLAAGTWNIRITLDDGTVHRTAIVLR